MKNPCGHLYALKLERRGSWLIMLWAMERMFHCLVSRMWGDVAGGKEVVQSSFAYAWGSFGLLVIAGIIWRSAMPL